MEEILSPAHGISWAALIFVAGGCYFLIKSLDRDVRKHTKILEDLLLNSREFTTKLVRCIDDLKDVTREHDQLKETMAEHVVWAGERTKSIDANHLAVVDRISRLEGKIFNGGNKYGS